MTAEDTTVIMEIHILTVSDIKHFPAGNRVLLSATASNEMSVVDQEPTIHSTQLYQQEGFKKMIFYTCLYVFHRIVEK